MNLKPFVGIGGGRIPYDVNTALVPAALNSIAALAEAGFFPSHPEWPDLAKRYAKIWKDTTLDFFEVVVPASKVESRLDRYKRRTGFAGPTQIESVENNNVTFYALALDGNDQLEKVEVMNSDDCFRLFLLNDTNSIQATKFINQAANNVRRRFPAGLMTDVSMVVANPAYGLEEVYATNWTTNAYHGTVVWSWQLAMMAKGFELQLSRCSDESAVPCPLFCSEPAVYENVIKAYNVLWDSIEKNKQYLSSEVWSWIYRDGNFVQYPLGALPGSSSTGKYDDSCSLHRCRLTCIESDTRQLWSLTFLAVTRNSKFRIDR